MDAGGGWQRGASLAALPGAAPPGRTAREPGPGGSVGCECPPPTKRRRDRGCGCAAAPLQVTRRHLGEGRPEARGGGQTLSASRGQ